MRVQRKQSLESNKKRSEAMKGKKHTDETKMRISEKMKEYWSKIPILLGDNNKEETILIDEEQWK